MSIQNRALRPTNTGSRAGLDEQPVRIRSASRGSSVVSVG
jgi:hypothetical protein